MIRNDLIFCDKVLYLGLSEYLWIFVQRHLHPPPGEGAGRPGGQLLLQVQTLLTFDLPSATVFARKLNSTSTPGLHLYPPATSWSTWWRTEENTSFPSPTLPSLSITTFSLSFYSLSTSTSTVPFSCLPSSRLL